MEHTGHVMLVGEGAERFAVARGFPRENLLTDHSRKIWLLWKEFSFRLVGTGIVQSGLEEAGLGVDTRRRLPEAH